MNTRSIDRLNIGLMLISCILAFAFPFQLFLFSFAVLGPLHYYTEIPWLHGKKYFTTGKYDFIVLIVFAVAISVIHFIVRLNYGDKTTFNLFIDGFAFAALTGALAFATLKSNTQKILALAIIGIASLWLTQLSDFGMIFSSLVPTIVHVYIFTGAFILYGALRHKSPTGIASLGVFVLCTLAIFLIQPSPTSDRNLSEYIRKSYALFAGLNFDLMNILGMQHTTQQTPALGRILFLSDPGIIIMRLIAFSYTYHFLNWFSKTSIIKWHLIPKKSLAMVLLLWFASLALYAIDYEIGLRYLFVVSLLHVVLEYPLNHKTFIAIGTELKAIATGKRTAETAKA